MLYKSIRKKKSVKWKKGWSEKLSKVSSLRKKSVSEKKKSEGGKQRKKPKQPEKSTPSLWITTSKMRASTE